MPNPAPPTKRIKLESASPEPPSSSETGQQKTAQQEEDHCSICLQPIADRALIPHCSHEFCFECLIVWSEQSRRCPLCSQGIGEYVIHHIRSKYDYQKHYLTPLRTSPRPLQPLSVSGSAQYIASRRPTRREREWGRRERQQREEADLLQRSISKRRQIYSYNLYAKHVASNTYTRYRPFPTPAQFTASPDYMSRTTTFVRRELQVWPNLDVEFLTTFVLSIMKSIDIRSESAVKLISEFLDMDEPYVEGGRHPNAEHFAHEIYCYLRSPYRDLYVYDTVVQYDAPPDVQPPPTEFERTSRWRDRSTSRLRSPSVNRSPPPSPPRSSRNRHVSSEKPVVPSIRRLSRSHSPPQSRSQYQHSARKRRLGSESDEVVCRTGVDHLNHRESFQSKNLCDSDLSLGPPTRSDETARAKGKERAQETVLNVEEQIKQDCRDGQEDLTNLDDSRITVPPVVLQGDDAHRQSTFNNEKLQPPRAARHNIKGGRGRTLLESVHSHLSLSQTNGNRKPRPTKPVDSGAKETGSEAGLSLLARLSEPQVQVAPSAETPQRSSESCPQQEAKPSSLPAPDIMAVTRTRLAKLKQETIAGIPPSAPTPPPITPSTSSSSSSTPNPLRFKLLDRLEAEKRQVADGPQVLSTPETSLDTAGTLDGEAVKAESKLRMQAQLRVRLAAAKRDQHRPQGDLGKEDSRREEALRAKLKGSGGHSTGPL